MTTCRLVPQALPLAAAVLVLATAGQGAWAQQQAPAGAAAGAADAWPSNVRRGYLGLNVGRSDYRVPCGVTALTCDTQDESLHLYTGTMFGRYWGAELGLLDLGSVGRAGGRTRARGLNLSLVGRVPVWQSLGAFGKLGTTYGRTETSAQAASGLAAGSESGFGLSYGAGLSWDFTTRLSAVVEWDSHDFRFAGGRRDPVRSTSLGLQYRY